MNVVKGGGNTAVHIEGAYKSYVSLIACSLHSYGPVFQSLQNDLSFLLVLGFLLT